MKLVLITFCALITIGKRMYQQQYDRGGSKDEFTIIDWDGEDDWDHLRSNIPLYRFGSKQVSRDYAAQWLTYLHAWIEHGINALYRTNMLAIHYELSQRHQCTIPHRYIHTRGSIDLYAPCHLLLFQAQHLCECVWTITVHKYFMINVTVSKAFVPYTRNCKHNYLTFAQNIHGRGFTFNKWEQIMENYSDNYCGHIYNEVVYSEENNLVMMLKVSVENVAHFTQLLAFYQIHIVGWANRYNAPIYKLHYNYLSPKYPSQYLFIDGQFTIVYYLTNNIIDDSLVYPQVKIHTLECDYMSAWIEIFPGLLSQYMRKWVVNPHKVFHCNIIYVDHVVMHMIFHMYTTMAVTSSVYDKSTTVSLQFHAGLVKNLTKCHSKGVYTGNLHNAPALSVTCLKKPDTNLQLTSVEHSGPQSTVPLQQIRAPGNELQYNQGMIKHVSSLRGIPCTAPVLGERQVLHGKCHDK